MNFFKKFKLKNKDIRNKNDYINSYYLLGIISIYFLCQTIKSTTLIKPGKHNYVKEDFQNFVYNLLISLFFIYCLVHQVINNKIFDYKYWIISHISSICFAFLNKIKVLQFSLDSKKNYSIIQDNIILVTSIIIIFFIIRQIYKKNVKYSLIFRFLLIYIMIFFLFISKTKKIQFHLHHCLVCSFFSLFFTNFKSKIDLYIHAILIGIIVQGFNFFKTEEIFLFYVNVEAPDTIYLCKLYIIYIIIWVLLLLLRRYWCKKYNNNRNLNKYEIQLIPSNEELGLYITPTGI
jgi:hypothetical protein